jgi:Zn-dependent protease
MTVNFSLAAFNMIPLPPLDGSRILNAVLPAFWRPILDQIGRYGLPALFLLILVGGSYTAGIIYAIAGPVYNLLLQVFAPSFG